METPEGIRLHYVDVGPRDALPVVMVHGWPDLWFGWRCHQIQALGSKYRLLVPDVRGFGQSSTPANVEAYGAKNISNDLAALLDELKIAKAVFCRPRLGRKSRVADVSVSPRESHRCLRSLHALYSTEQDLHTIGSGCEKVPQFKYQQFLANTDVSGKVLDASPRRLLTAMFRKPSEMGLRASRMSLPKMLMAVDSDLDHPVFTQCSTLLSEAELDYYVKQYSISKFASACQTYATGKIDFENERGLSRVIKHPALFIGAAKDAVLKPEMARGMAKVIPNLETRVIKDAGHWVLWEQKEEVNAILSEWLAKIATTASVSNLSAKL
ncbi:Eukaryotic translation initiation factor 3 subunit G [Phytophthora nicotianae]|uniref:Eukaryotic translation initiation factor 3 subunit G n=1 Tax=Phytophthora nicotianae TaxID=4792 RepID=A0A0W8CXN5_PHYNI|nr:Eukaryotic translation initiation factor 3 subunit G [Phytophthora nicotianae]